MGFRKNGVSLRKGLSTSVLVSSFILLTGLMSSAAATNYCCPEIDFETGSCQFLNGTAYIDFLYWQVNPDGLEFARKGGIADEASGSVLSQGEIFETSCSMEPGVRAGLIINLGQCDWDLSAQYTYLSPEFGNSASVPFETPGLQPLIFNAAQLSDINLALGQYNSCMHVLDVGFGKTFEVKKCFSFRPHFGIKATWQKIRHNVTYELITDVLPPPNPSLVAAFQRYNANFETDFDGVGPRGGFDASWRFNRSLSVVGNLAVSALWSDLTNSRQDFFSIHVLNPQTFEFDEVFAAQNADITHPECVLIPVAELLFGLRWDDCLCGCYPIFVFIGWENQVWFNLSRAIMVSNFADNNYSFGPQGNISYQGLVTRVGVSF
jgi:hypothetical protein